MHIWSSLLINKIKVKKVSEILQKILWQEEEETFIVALRRCFPGCYWWWLFNIYCRMKERVRQKNVSQMLFNNDQNVSFDHCFELFVYAVLLWKRRKKIMVDCSNRAKKNNNTKRHRERERERVKSTASLSKIKYWNLSCNQISVQMWIQYVKFKIITSSSSIYTVHSNE